MEQRVRLWDAINRYVTACRGDPSKYVYGNTPRMKAVAEVEAVVQEAVAARAEAPTLAEIEPRCADVRDAIMAARIHQPPPGPAFAGGGSIAFGGVEASVPPTPEVLPEGVCPLCEQGEHRVLQLEVALTAASRALEKIGSGRSGATNAMVAGEAQHAAFVANRVLHGHVDPSGAGGPEDDLVALQTLNQRLAARLRAEVQAHATDLARAHAAEGRVTELQGVLEAACVQTGIEQERAERAEGQVAALRTRLSGLARAGENLARATPDKVLRMELERFVRLAKEALPGSPKASVAAATNAATTPPSPKDHAFRDPYDYSGRCAVPGCGGFMLEHQPRPAAVPGVAAPQGEKP